MTASVECDCSLVVNLSEHVLQIVDLAVNFIKLIACPVTMGPLAVGLSRASCAACARKPCEKSTVEVRARHPFTIRLYPSCRYLLGAFIYSGDLNGVRPAYPTNDVIRGRNRSDGARLFASAPAQ